MAKYLFILLALPVMLAAQSLVKYSVAAAAGTAAGATMGKHLSKTLDNVMAAAAEAADPKGYTKQPEGPYEKKPELRGAAKLPGAPPVKPAAASVRIPSPRGRATLFRTPVPDFPGMETNPPAESEQVIAEATPPPPPPQPTVDGLRNLEVGSARGHVVANLGAPMARITMAGEQGALVEIYYYQSRGESLGSVRFNDGALSSVIVNQ
ncbi:MAG: hypothetical protein FJW20_24595 [Acidimicrobiia bacterium]|nr:hypothetical protein [Acidimicrobiia bacterium]